MQSHESDSYLKKRIKSFGHAFSGVAIFFRETPHARVHFIATILVIAAGLLLGVSTNEWLVLIICIVLVLALEAVNSALEYLVDLVTEDFHPLAKKAKDVGAAAVLIAATGSVAVAAMVFIPKLIALFGQ